jgi:flagellar biosynthetic protein FliQ
MLQVLTSLQDNTISTVSRLIATGSAVFLAMPWMWRHLAHLTLTIFSNFQAYTR